MRETRTSGLMSGDGKRSDAQVAQATAPVLDSTEALRDGRWVIPTALIDDRSGPLAAGDRGQAVGRRHEPVPGLAAGRDDGLVVRPDPQAELVLPQVLPHVLDRVQLGAVARQRQEGEVLRD